MGKSILIVAGNLGRDPELRYTQTGREVANLSIACDHTVGERVITIWWQITLWGERAVAAAQHLRKGRFVVAICHSAHARQYVASDGSQAISMDATAWDVIYGPKTGSSEEETDGLELLHQAYAMGMGAAAAMAQGQQGQQEKEPEVSAPPAATPRGNGRRRQAQKETEQEEPNF
jgi:single-stranded DNA-binding protein